MVPVVSLYGLDPQPVQQGGAVAPALQGVEVLVYGAARFAGRLGDLVVVPVLMRDQDQVGGQPVPFSGIGIHIDYGSVFRGEPQAPMALIQQFCHSSNPLSAIGTKVPVALFIHTAPAGKNFIIYVKYTISKKGVKFICLSNYSSNVSQQNCTSKLIANPLWIIGKRSFSR